MPPKKAVPPKVVFEPGKEAVAVANELAKEESLKAVALLAYSSGYEHEIVGVCI